VSFNSFGRLLRVTTWGESHGPAIGAVVDGCPPGLALSESDIQPWLDRRRPGASRFTTQRRETDSVRILSGTFEGLTTGTPISLLIENIDQRSKDYDEISLAYRPGHADYTYDAKYGLRDWRGGGRSSARETAARVAAAGIARRIIPEVRIRAYLVELGGDAVERSRIDLDEIDRNPLNCPDAAAVGRWERKLDEARKAGSSLGAIVECVAEGVPAGWGSPIYAKLDSELAAAMMSINAAKNASRMVGEEAWSGAHRIGILLAAEPRRAEALANLHALGGISTGQPVVVRTAFKPTSSILTPVPTIDREGRETEIVTKGRHDPCVAIRGAPVVEAMMALVLADQKLLHRAQCG
jgi:chorismate synthase